MEFLRTGRIKGADGPAENVVAPGEFFCPLNSMQVLFFFHDEDLCLVARIIFAEFAEWRRILMFVLNAFIALSAGGDRIMERGKGGREVFCYLGVFVQKIITKTRGLSRADAGKLRKLVYEMLKGLWGQKASNVSRFLATDRNVIVPWSKKRLIFPVGPLRCFSTRISAMFFFSAFCFALSSR